MLELEHTREPPSRQHRKPWFPAHAPYHVVSRAPLNYALSYTPSCIASAVLDIRGKQAAWDKAHRDIEDGYAPSGPHASGGNAGKRAALKKLGARPELTL